MKKFFVNPKKRIQAWAKWKEIQFGNWDWGVWNFRYF